MSKELCTSFLSLRLLDERSRSKKPVDLMASPHSASIERQSSFGVHRSAQHLSTARDETAEAALRIRPLCAEPYGKQPFVLVLSSSPQNSRIDSMN